MFFPVGEQWWTTAEATSLVRQNFSLIIVVIFNVDPPSLVGLSANVFLRHRLSVDAIDNFFNYFTGAFEEAAMEALATVVERRR